MADNVMMPQMGESIAEGTITTWLKAVGDTVERDEPLFEITTDKVDAEIPSPFAGQLLEIMVEAGSTVPIETVVARIGQDGEAAADTAPAAAAQAPQEAVSSPAAAAQDVAAGPASVGVESVEERRRVKSSPVVRKIAAEHGIELASLSGSGIGGRVTKQDILAVVDKGASSAPQAAVAPAVPVVQTAAAVVPAATGAAPTEVPAAYRAVVMEGDRVEEMSTMRSKIAEHMVLSKQISPHVGTVWEVDFSHVARLRKKYKSVWQESHGVNLTFTSFILKACIEALAAFPEMNASLDGNRVVYHRDINLGMAVALEKGLLVPVIHQAGELNLLGLTRRAGDLIERTRTKRLRPDEVQKGTFTVTNPGIYGPMFGIPVINQPQAAILGVGAVEKRPVVIDDMIGIRTRAYMSLSFDHRLIDGAVADQFMKRIKQSIEEFDAAELA